MTPPDDEPGGSGADDGPASETQDTAGRSSADPPGDSQAEDATEERSRWRRRALWLLVLFLLVAAGGGVGTFVLELDQEPGPAEPTPTPDGQANLTLTADANTTLLRAAGVAPGDSGTARLDLRNAGVRAGELVVVAFSVRGAENGITSPEAAVDRTRDTGELGGVLLVSLSIEFAAGDSVTVAGTDRMVPLDAVSARNRTVGRMGAGETATVVLDWRLPGETGNAVQSDSVAFDVVFGLRSVEAATPGQ